MTKHETNVEISKVVKELNYLRINPTLSDEKLTDFLQKLKDLLVTLR